MPEHQMGDASESIPPIQRLNKQSLDAVEDHEFAAQQATSKDGEESSASSMPSLISSSESDEAAVELADDDSSNFDFGERLHAISSPAW